MKKTLSLFCLALMISVPALADDDRTAGARTPAHKSQSMSKQTGAKIDGWGNLKFGMSVDEAVGASPEIGWPEDGCVKTETLCKMKPADGYAATIGGLRFVPELGFDRFDRLVTISLTYDDFVRGTDCWGRFNTTMAGLEKRFGKFSAPMTEGLKLEKRRTPGGSHYSVERMDMGGTLLLMFKTATDIAAYETYSQNDIAGTGLRASRPFVSIVGATHEDSTLSCGYSIYYNAADMEAPKGVAGSDNADF